MSQSKGGIPPTARASFKSAVRAVYLHGLGTPRLFTSRTVVAPLSSAGATEARTFSDASAAANYILAFLTSYAAALCPPETFGAAMQPPSSTQGALHAAVMQVPPAERELLHMLALLLNAMAGAAGAAGAASAASDLHLMALNVAPLLFRARGETGAIRTCELLIAHADELFASDSAAPDACEKALKIELDPVTNTPLAPGWRAVLSPEYNQYYYVCDETGAASWDMPRASAADQAPSEQAAGEATDGAQLFQRVLAASDSEAMLGLLLDPQRVLFSALCDSVSIAEVDSVLGPLAALLLHQDEVLPVLDWLIEYEVARTLSAQTLFRGNSVASKLMVLVARPLAGPFLREIFRPVIELVIRDADSLDVDAAGGKAPRPSKPGKRQQAALAKLQIVAQLFLDSVLACTPRIPAELRNICASLQRATDAKFPKMRATIIGSFLFLRLICPFLNEPAAFGESFGSEAAQPEPRKALLLVSKILQNLANGARFTDANAHMMPLNSFLDTNEPAVLRFFDEVAVRTRVVRRDVNVLSDEARDTLLSQAAAFVRKHAAAFANVSVASAGPAAPPADGDELAGYANLLQSKPSEATCVFGISLTKLAERKRPGYAPPAALAWGGAASGLEFLDSWLELLWAVGQSQADVFRSTPPLYRLDAIRTMCACYDHGLSVRLGSDPAEICMLIKTFLTELPEPLLCAIDTADWLRPAASHAAQIAALAAYLASLPPAHRAVLACLARLLSALTRPPGKADLDTLVDVFAELWLRDGLDLTPCDGRSVARAIILAPELCDGVPAGDSLSARVPELVWRGVASAGIERQSRLVGVKADAKEALRDVQAALDELRRAVDACNDEDALLAIQRQAVHAASVLQSL